MNSDQEIRQPPSQPVTAPSSPSVDSPSPRRRRMFQDPPKTEGRIPLGEKTSKSQFFSRTAPATPRSRRPYKSYSEAVFNIKSARTSSRRSNGYLTNSGSFLLPSNSIEMRNLKRKALLKLPLTEIEYANKRKAEILSENPEIDEDEAENMALDEYPEYISKKIESGELEKLYAESSISDRIKLGRIVETAGYEVSDISATANKLSDTTKTTSSISSPTTTAARETPYPALTCPAMAAV